MREWTNDLTIQCYKDDFFLTQCHELLLIKCFNNNAYNLMELDFTYYLRHGEFMGDDIIDHHYWYNLSLKFLLIIAVVILGY